MMTVEREETIFVLKRGCPTCGTRLHVVKTSHSSGKEFYLALCPRKCQWDTFPSVFWERDLDWINQVQVKGDARPWRVDWEKMAQFKKNMEAYGGEDWDYRG